MTEPIQLVYHASLWKVLLDGERAEGFASDKFLNVNQDGIELKFVAMSPVLRKLMRTTPAHIKALYVDKTSTITIEMEIKDCKIQPISLGDVIPTVAVQLIGEANVNFED